MATAYDSLVAELQQLALIGSIASVLGWDERTAMPARAAAYRGEQTAFLAKLSHERFTADKIGDLISAAEAEVAHEDPHSPRVTNVRETRRTYARSRNLPTDLVEEISRTTVLSEHAWESARASNDFAAFSPWLEKMLALKRRQIACHGIPPGGEAYDVVLEDFEPGESAANLRHVFESLRGPLVELVGRIATSGKSAPLEILTRPYPARQQEAFAKTVASRVGFDFKAGVLAVSTHPFCSELGPDDVRMTTRYDDAYFGDAFFGVLHEMGHGLYDQGLPSAQYGLPAGQFISLGIHESQSRMWENLVGRSRAFWRCFFPDLARAFPDALAGVTEDEWFRAVNDVRPSLIRVEADEATYNLHVLLRFELEIALLSGDLSVADLPGAWDEKMKKYLGLSVPSNAQGCMQDVHWSAGLIGYFPTYTLGNLYSAQFFEQAHTDLGDLQGRIAAGDFAGLLGWLRSNIHDRGQCYRAPELVQKVTGRPLSPEPLLHHLRTRAAEVYGV